MNHLNKRRDELAEKIGANFKEYENMAFKDGFDAAITELQPEIDRLVEALEFYAETKNWHGIFGKFDQVDDSDIYKHKEPWDNSVGGKKARGALQRWREFKGE